MTTPWASTGYPPASGAPPTAPAWASLPPNPQPPLPHVTAGRVIGGLFLTGFAWLFFAYLPYRVEEFVAAHGFATPLGASTALAIGTALALTTGFAHIVKPTSLWGPAVVASAVVGIMYIGLLLAHPSLTVNFGSFASFSVEYRTLLLVLLAAPVLRLASGVVVTAEDLHRPGERVRLQFR